MKGKYMAYVLLLIIAVISAGVIIHNHINPEMGVWVMVGGFAIVPLYIGYVLIPFNKIFKK